MERNMHTSVASKIMIFCVIGIFYNVLFSECLLEWTLRLASLKRSVTNVELNIEIDSVPVRDCWGTELLPIYKLGQKNGVMMGSSSYSIKDIYASKERNGTVLIEIVKINRTKLVIPPWSENLTVLYDTIQISNITALDSINNDQENNVTDENDFKLSDRCDVSDGNKMRVLILHPLYAGSHEMTLRAVGEELARAGHHVTQVRFKSNIMLSTGEAFTSNDHSACSGIRRAAAGEGRLEVVTLSLPNRDLRYPFMAADGMVQVPTQQLWSETADMFKVPWSAHRLIEAHCSSVLGSQELLQALRSRNFSVAVVDLLGNDCGVALARLLGLPLLGSWEIAVQASSFESYGATLPLGAVPRVMTRLSDDMTFWERVHNVLHSRLAELLLFLYYRVIDFWIQYYHSELPSIRSLLLEVDAVLVNMHVSLDYPLQLPPHVRYVGCVTCRSGRALPRSLLTWMTDAPTSEVVVMSFGFTGFDPSAIPPNFIEEVLDGLGNITQRVILQFDEIILTKIPPNVLISKWIPLQDVLGYAHFTHFVDPYPREELNATFFCVPWDQEPIKAHELTVLHVSHCGVKAVSETVHHGVPLLCIPAFGDQGDVSARVQQKRLGRVVDRRGLTAGRLVAAVTSVLADRRIKETVKKTSRMWQEEDPAMHTFVKWLVKVDQFSPLDHLHSPHKQQLSFLHYTALDASLFCALIICLVPFLLTRLLCSELWRHYAHKIFFIIYLSVRFPNYYNGHASKNR